jgi:hypothetical protein
MSTERHVEANRQNAQKSTGPTARRKSCRPSQRPQARPRRSNRRRARRRSSPIRSPARRPRSRIPTRHPDRRIPGSPARHGRLTLGPALPHGSRLLQLPHKRKVHYSGTEYVDLNADERIAFTALREADGKDFLFNLHRYEMRLERSAKSARQELESRRLALLNTAAPVKQPKAKPSPKIINIETAERPPAPVIPAAEPPPSSAAGYRRARPQRQLTMPNMTQSRPASSSHDRSALRSITELRNTGSCSVSSKRLSAPALVGRSGGGAGWATMRRSLRGGPYEDSTAFRGDVRCAVAGACPCPGD